MNPEHVKVLVTKRMQQATETLDDGKYLLAAGRGERTAVNRAYYAVFYAVLALLQTVGKTPAGNTDQSACQRLSYTSNRRRYPRAFHSWRASVQV